MLGLDGLASNHVGDGPGNPQYAMPSRTDKVALPFCHLELKQEKSSSYPMLADCKSLGDHLKRRRLQLNLRQVDVAARLGVDSCTLRNWESGSSEPMVHSYPAVMEFLGYCPYHGLTPLVRG